MCSCLILGRPDRIRWWWPASRWGGKTGCGGGVCHGQEVAVEANAGDSDAFGGVWVSEDGGVSRGGYLKGLIYLKYLWFVDLGETKNFGSFLSFERVMAVISYKTGHVVESQHRKWNTMH